MTQPQILYLVHRLPYPPQRGDRIRSFHLLKFLAARADVHLGFLAAESPPWETLQVLRNLCVEVAAVPLGRWRRWAQAAWSLARGRTATEGLFASPRLKGIVDRWARHTRFDAVVVFCSSMAQYVDVPGLAGAAVIVDLVDVDSQKWFDYAAQSRGLKRQMFRLEGRRLRGLESALAQRARAVTLVSSAEAALYREFSAAPRVHVVGNGVDLEYFRAAQPRGDQLPQRQTPPGCVFVGALDYRANIDGICWFCREVWPEVRRGQPEATFTIVGANPAAAIRRLARLPGVALAADVPDVRPYLARAALVVVPLRVARGVQNKVLEALAMGKAVVATPQALEGLGIVPGVHAEVATTPAEWQAAVTHLFGDAHARDSLGRSGREYVEGHHRWECRLEPLAALIGLPRSPIKRLDDSLSRSQAPPGKASTRSSDSPAHQEAAKQSCPTRCSQAGAWEQGEGKG